MLKEFKAFALKGNLLDTAVGLVLALAFITVVTAFINGIIMPLIAAIVGQPSFDGIVWTIGGNGTPADPGTDILIGTFITAVVNFLLIAWVLFLIVKAANRMRKPVEVETGPTEVELLTEIRDALAARNA
ncbi:MAG: large conductance mechanosensitive channel protein MscL [Actinomycetota bacterium]